MEWSLAKLDGQQEEEHEIPPENNIMETQADDASNEEWRNQTDAMKQYRRRKRNTPEKRHNTIFLPQHPNGHITQIFYSDQTSLPRLQKVKPQPNLNAAQCGKKNKDSTPKS